ncbi:hypothetical protein HKCCE3408_04385 [Rhodobacterales bacterium HKCCE3408]|nr:hypothetical protein [Rhodobacterales bacterium HKCCE3408]
MRLLYPLQFASVILWPLFLLAGLAAAAGLVRLYRRAPRDIRRDLTMALLAAGIAATAITAIASTLDPIGRFACRFALDALPWMAAAAALDLLMLLTLGLGDRDRVSFLLLRLLTHAAFLSVFLRGAGICTV